MVSERRSHEKGQRVRWLPVSQHEDGRNHLRNALTILLADVV